MSEARARLCGAWAALVEDAMVIALGACETYHAGERPPKHKGKKHAPGTEQPPPPPGFEQPPIDVTVDTACAASFKDPGVVQVSMSPVAADRQLQPVQCARVVPGQTLMPGPFQASVEPTVLLSGAGTVDVTLPPSLPGGLYVGQVTDANGRGAPFVIYLDDLP